MRLLKDRILNDISSSEITNIAFEPRKKLIAAGSFQEPILIFKYPYMKLFKKIIHREKTFVNEDEDPTFLIDKNVITELDGKKYIKGNIITAKSVEFSNTGTFLIIGYENGDLLVYNTTLWKKETELNFSGSITSMNFAKKGTILCVFLSDWNLILLDTKTWEIIKKHPIGPSSDGRAFTTSDLTKYFIITDKKRVKQFKLEPLEEIRVFKAHNSGINMIKLSPDGKTLATCGNDCKLSLFDINTGELKSYLIGHSDEVHSFSFSLESDFIVSSSEDNSLRLWDAKTFKCVKIMHDIPNSFVMRRYGEKIFLGNVDGGISSYKLY